MLSARLRSETETAHRELESRLDLFNRIRTADAYRDLLIRFYAFYAAVEPRLKNFTAEFADRGLDLDSRWKLPALAADLKDLGEDPEKITARGSPEIPVIRTAAEALGCLYVLEGSTLGSQVICREFRKTLPDTVHSALRFYAGYGSETGNRWRDFRQFLDRSDWNANSVVESANDTFQKIRAALCEKI